MNSAIFMASLLSNLLDNLAEVIKLNAKTAIVFLNMKVSNII